MINSSSPQPPASVPEDEAIETIVRAGPGGAVAVAGVATAIVVGLWFAFYLFVFLPRSVP
ncbi:hypothetical protein ACE10Z_19150 [Bradyrhizobium sp. Pha-3]|uniref:hypothetical protein n=1 Tax=Bradyrhizobium sp. Pha-3 TaxID=208375 RepID=UPI0035D46E46